MIFKSKYTRNRLLVGFRPDFLGSSDQGEMAEKGARNRKQMKGKKGERWTEKGR